MIILSMHLLPRINVMFDFICMDSVDMRGARGKRKRITKWKILAHSETRIHNLEIRIQSYWASHDWWKALLLKWPLYKSPIYRSSTVTWTRLFGRVLHGERKHRTSASFCYLSKIDIIQYVTPCRTCTRPPRHENIPSFVPSDC